MASKRKNLPQSDEEEEEEEFENAVKEGQASLPLLPAPSQMDTIQIMEKLDLFRDSMESRFDKLEKIVVERYNDVNDHLIDIEIEISYHHYKLQEYFKA